MKLTPFPKNRTKKRILIINCYFDDMRLPVGRKSKLPHAMGPAYLAGAFSDRMCDIRLYNEVYSGPLEDEKLLSWPDMLVLTGLNTSFDRMLHLTAYVRTKNRDVIVVAGGPAIRALPSLSKGYFDILCMGDMEEMVQVAEEALGKEYAVSEMHPRFDLAYWMGPYGYVESSRYCNFKCSFCSLTGENRTYQKYDLEVIRKQIVSQGKRKNTFIFLDNNFYGNDRRYFLDRVELIKELRGQGYIKKWSAPVTNDLFHRSENLKLAREAGCIALFSGLESFDMEWLRSIKKLQNVQVPQIEMIRRCIDQGIVFLYGIIFDVTSRPVSYLREELEFILDTPDIPLPSYFSIIAPILGTPFFYDCLDKNLFLPKTKLRDLDSTTLSLKPMDPIDEVATFISDIQTLRGYKRQVLQHSYGFFRKYRAVLSPFQMAVALSNGAITALQLTPDRWFRLNPFHTRNRSRTHVSTTEPLDQAYRPIFRVDSQYEGYFKPTFLTDEAGYLTEDLEQDVLNSNAARDKIARLGQPC